MQAKVANGRQLTASAVSVKLASGPWEQLLLLSWLLEHLLESCITVDQSFGLSRTAKINVESITCCWSQSRLQSSFCRQLHLLPNNIQCRVIKEKRCVLQAGNLYAQQADYTK